MAITLWNWYSEIDGNGRVFVIGIHRGEIQKESVKKLAGIFARGMLLETVKGHRISLEYAGALDPWIPSYAAVKFPEYQCKPETEESIDLKLEADYCGGRVRADSPLLFYLLCRMAWESGQRERSNSELWPVRNSHLYAVNELIRVRKKNRRKELQKPEKLLKIMRKQELFLELGIGEPFFLKRVYWKNAKGTVSDETKWVEREDTESLMLIYYSNKDCKTGKSTKENKPPNVYFAYVSRSNSFDFLYLLGEWLNCIPGFLRVGNVGKEPLCVFGKEKAPGYVIPPGRQYAMDGEEIKYCETKPWSLLERYL